MRRIPRHEGAGRDIGDHHGTGCDEGLLAHMDTANQRRVGAHSGAFGDTGRDENPISASAARSRTQVIGECGTRADEDVVLELHALPDMNAILHHHAIAQDGAAFDEGMVTEIAVPASMSGLGA